MSSAPVRHLVVKVYVPVSFGGRGVPLGDGAWIFEVSEMAELPPVLFAASAAPGAL
jgi:hypothetical protein